MKHFLLFILWLLAPASLLRAEPAYPYPFYVEQKDGSRICVRIRGDEHFHFMEADDGTVIVRGEDQSFYYAEVVGQSIRRTLRLAHNLKDRTPDERQFASVRRADIRQLLSHMQTVETERRRRNAAELAPTEETRQQFFGQKRGLVLLVDFPDCPFSSPSAPDEIRNSFNQKGYSNNGHIGSVSDYFYDQSYGRFELSFDVIGPIRASRNLAYYGENGSSASNTDIHIGELVDEVIRQAAQQVDFSLYDWNGDGEVEQVFLVYAGYAESSGAPSYTIWPHQFSLDGCKSIEHGGNGALTFGGIKVNTYACSSELNGVSGNTLRGIGTVCHEYSHCLGLPDFYDVNYSGGFGMNVWSLMGSGSYNGKNANGEAPCGYSAYERWALGWLNLTELNEPERIRNMPCLGDAPLAYLLRNDGCESEYFILENRQNTRWFSYAGSYTGCHGMLITHVDYSASAWERNRVNIYPTHQHMTIVPADGDYGNLRHSGNQAYYSTSRQDLLGDLFPGANGITAFTNDSHSFAGGRLFNANTDGSQRLNKPITNISEQDGLISFDVLGGIYVPVPQITDIAWGGENRCLLTWTVDSPVDSFEISAIEVRNTPLSSQLLTENFANFQFDSPDTMDLSSFANLLFQTRGWKTQGIYQSVQGMRLGSRHRDAYCTTPPFSVTGSHLTVYTGATPTDSTGLIHYYLFNARGDTLSDNRPCEVAGNQLLVFDGLAADSYRLRIESDHDVVLNKLNVYDAALTEQDLLWNINIKPQQRITLTGITGDSLLLPALKAKTFKVRIRASLDGAFSEWSDYSLVDMNALPVRSVSMSLADHGHEDFYRLDGTRIDAPWGKGLYIRKRGNNRSGLFLRH